MTTSFRLQENISLSTLTSLHVGGPARYVATVTSEDELVEALTLAQDKGLPYFVLGKGSNTLFSDAGFEGVIILMANRDIRFAGTLVTAGAGVFMRRLVTTCLDRRLRGLEDLAGIPGTVGGAVRGNAGTWQTEVKDVLHTVEVFRPDDEGRWFKVIMKPEECSFGYRHSIFKQHRDWVVLAATFITTVGDAAEGMKLVQQDLTARHEKQPYTAPSAGSVFKNPDKAAGIFSGRIISEAGLKGARIGGAQISEKHGNFIINTGKASATDVIELVRLVQKTVRKKFHIELEPEIEIVE